MDSIKEDEIYLDKNDEALSTKMRTSRAILSHSNTDCYYTPTTATSNDDLDSIFNSKDDLSETTANPLSLNYSMKREMSSNVSDTFKRVLKSLLNDNLCKEYCHYFDELNENLIITNELSNINAPIEANKKKFKKVSKSIQLCNSIITKKNELKDLNKQKETQQQSKLRFIKVRKKIKKPLEKDDLNINSSDKMLRITDLVVAMNLNEDKTRIDNKINQESTDKYISKSFKIKKYNLNDLDELEIAKRDVLQRYSSIQNHNRTKFIRPSAKIKL
jgi:hypothetical protein